LFVAKQRNALWAYTVHNRADELSDNRKDTIVSPQTIKQINDEYIALWEQILLATMPVIESEEGVVSFHDIDETQIVTQVG
jgi:hypothetical protein